MCPSGSNTVVIRTGEVILRSHREVWSWEVCQDASEDGQEGKIKEAHLMMKTGEGDKKGVTYTYHGGEFSIWPCLLLNLLTPI